MFINPKYDPADYFLDNYGQCKLERCLCLKNGWIGRACPNWKPSGEKSFEELYKSIDKLDYQPKSSK